MSTINDPHFALALLEETKKVLQIYLPEDIHNEFQSVMDECLQLLKMYIN